MEEFGDKKSRGRPPSWWMRVTSFKRASLALPPTHNYNNTNHHNPNSNGKLSDSPLGPASSSSPSGGSRHHRSSTTMGSDDYSSDSSDIYGFPPLIPKRSSSLLDQSMLDNCSAMTPSSRQSMIASSDCSADWLVLTQSQFSPAASQAGDPDTGSDPSTMKASEHSFRTSGSKGRRKAADETSSSRRSGNTGRRSVGGMRRESPEDIPPPLPPRNASTSLKNISRQPIISEFQSANNGVNGNIIDISCDSLVKEALSSGSIASASGPGDLSVHIPLPPYPLPPTRVEAATQTSRTLDKKSRKAHGAASNPQRQSDFENGGLMADNSTTASSSTSSPLSGHVRTAYDASPVPTARISSRRSSQSSTPLSLHNSHHHRSGHKSSDSTNESPQPENVPQHVMDPTGGEYHCSLAIVEPTTPSSMATDEFWYATTTSGSSDYGGYGDPFTTTTVTADLSLSSDMTSEEVAAKLHWKLDMIRADEVELSARIAHLIATLASRGLTSAVCDKLRAHAIQIEMVTKLTLLLSNRLFQVERDLKSDLPLVPLPLPVVSSDLNLPVSEAAAASASPEPDMMDDPLSASALVAEEEFTAARRLEALLTKKSLVMSKLSDAESLRRWINGRGRRHHAHLASRIGATQADEYSSLLKARARLVVDRQDILDKIYLTERHARLDAFAYLQ